MKIRKIIIAFIVIIFIAINLPLITCFANNESSNEKNELKIYSEAAILVDTKTGKILYNKNAKERKYPASTTKILTAIITIENCKLDDKVIVDYDSIMAVPPGYTVAALQVGEELTVRQLLEIMLVHSANDAANVLAKFVGDSIDSFSSMMNTKADEIGCKDSHFLNPSGKHEDDHYTTAYDLALIMKYCMNNETFRELSSIKSCIIPATNKYEQRIFSNTNELLVVDTREIGSNYYYPYAIAGKTGYTTEAKNCLVSMACKDDFELICVVLGGIRTDDGLSAKFVDTKQLYEYGYNTYTIRKLREKGAIATQIEIPKATKETKNLDLLISNDIDVLIKQKDLNKEIEPQITIQENLNAPIAQNQVLGTIEYNIEGVKYKSDILASHVVEKDNSLFLIIQLILIAIIIFVLYKIIFSKSKKISKHSNNYFFDRDLITK